MKKILSLILALAMTFSMVSATSFVDQDAISVDYLDDVNMLAQLGVVDGYEDGTFRPQDTISRVEYAKMAYVLNYGYDDKGELFSGQVSQFSDVEGNTNVAWGKGYINYCAKKGIVAGMGNGKFAPTANITVAEVAKMLLVTLGCDPVKEGFVGSNWQANVVAKAMETGVFDGWAGDPTRYATRELVCKLMRNTIFSPIYVYSPITGIGSQVNLLDANEENPTLGEKVMGLKHVEGLVVSNGRYALSTDEEGEPLDGVTASTTKDKSQIYYEVEDKDEMGLLTIDTDLSDDMLGCLVDVYYTDNKGSRVELVGEVLVDAKTVAYDVMSADIEIMPNGDSNSKREVKPYIQFTTEDGIKTVQLRGENSTKREPSNEAYDGEAFLDLMYFSDITYNNDNGNLYRPVVDDIVNMGKNYIQSYRFVSVDGGATWSYIFRLNNREVKRVGSITNDTISVSGAGMKDLDDEAVIIGDVEKGDMAVVYSKDGKLYVEDTNVISGKATSFGEDYVIINGDKYYSDLATMEVELPEWFVQDDNMGKNNSYTEYTVYKNYVIDIDSEYVTAAVNDYAVVLYSTYDAGIGTAKVKLAFTDGSEGVYEVSDVYGANEDEELAKFEDNGVVGKIYQVDIKNGMADLSAMKGSDVTSYGADIIDGNFVIKTEDGSNTYYPTEGSVMFLLYGADNGSLKAKAYKMSNLDFATGAPTKGTSYASIIKSSTSHGMRSVLVGAMSIGAELDNFNAEVEDLAYIVSAKKNYNIDTNEWYLDVEMITEDGYLVARSVDEVRNHKGQNVYFTDNKIGATPDNLKPGSIVTYNYADGFIQSIGAFDFDTYTDGKANGVFKVTIAAERNDLIGFFVDKTFTGNEDSITVDYTVRKDEHNYEVIAIDDNEFVEDGDIELFTKDDKLDSGEFNAIIVIEDGYITRVFSLHNNF